MNSASFMCTISRIDLPLLKKKKWYAPLSQYKASFDPILSLASLLFHLHDEENGKGWNLEVAQEKIVVATIVITFVANICQKVVTLGYLGLDLQ